MFNKKGDVISVTLSVILLVVVAAVILFSVYGEGSVVIDSLPEGIGLFYEILGKIFTPIIDFVYIAVAPSGEGDNVQAVAVSIFLLLSIVGAVTLKPFFKSRSVSLVVSLIVGVIAARSLTATILAESALGASPLAATSLLLGLIPVLGLANGIRKLGLSNWSNLVVYIVVAFVYMIFFTYIFDAVRLGAVYAVGILLLGVGQIVAPYYARKRGEIVDRNLGAYMSGVQETVQTARQMQAGAEFQAP